MIVGLTGFASAGKNALGEALTHDHGFAQIAFADPLREMLYALNPLIGDGCRVQELVDGMGWDWAKRAYPEIRGLLQRLGTEAGRVVLGQRVWVNLGMERATRHERTVITDVRFANEAQAVLAAGGEVWRVVRPGVGPVNGHVSDRGLPDDLVTRTIVNDGSLSDLAYAAFGALIAAERSGDAWTNG